ncbi:MAG: hypothetical protein WB511_12400 [Nitrososphaeraceae archaeon]
MVNFSSNWTKQKKKEPTEFIRDTLRGQKPLKPTMQTARNKIGMQSQKLDQLLEKLKSKDRSLFAQIISQLQHHDIQQSKMLSNELSQVRKTMKTVSQLKLSLDQVHMRLESTLDIGDAMAALKPAVGTLYSVKTGLTGVMPNVDLELSEINSVFGDIMLNAESAGEISLALGQGGDDVSGIISEAHAIAEQRVNDSFPDIPSNTFGNTRTTLGEHPQ